MVEYKERKNPETSKEEIMSNEEYLIRLNEVKANNIKEMLKILKAIANKLGVQS